MKSIRMKFRNKLVLSLFMVFLLTCVTNVSSQIFTQEDSEEESGPWWSVPDPVYDEPLPIDGFVITGLITGAAIGLRTVLKKKDV